jgi:hypothetical protein
LEESKLDTYEVSRLLASLSYQDWITKEVFSLKWFLMVGVLVIIYSVWLKLLDKTRLKDLMLYGSLLAVEFMLSDVIMGSFLGLYSYKVNIIPLKPPVFIASITILPILFMMVMQYTASWWKFILWASIAAAAYSFLLVPLYTQLGILYFYKGYNHIYSFLRSIAGAIIGRTIFLWFEGIQQRHLAARPVSRQIATENIPAIIPKPVMKPLDNKENKEN